MAETSLSCTGWFEEGIKAMTRNRFHAVMVFLSLTVGTALVSVWQAEAVPPGNMLGDPAKIPTLRFSSVPKARWDHYIVPCNFCDAMQIQYYMRTGVDPGPLSPQYTITSIGQRDPRDDITTLHGWSSPWLGVSICQQFGSCAAALCPPNPLTFKVSAAAKADAEKYKTSGEFLQLKDVPDYPAAVKHIAAHPGDVCILTNEGRESYAIIGVDAQGRGIWLDHNRVGPPLVRHLTEAEGAAIWSRMIYRTDNPRRNEALEPAGFMVVMPMGAK
jgi:hypothetical protein